MRSLLSTKSNSLVPRTETRSPKARLPEPSRSRLAGGVEASGAVTGRTGPLHGCELNKVAGQTIVLDAELSVTPGDDTELLLILGFLSTHMAPSVFYGQVDFAGPTSVTFGPGGEVVKVELDALSGTFTLTRVQGEDQPSEQRGSGT